MELNYGYVTTLTLSLLLLSNKYLVGIMYLDIMKH